MRTTTITRFMECVCYWNESGQKDAPVRLTFLFHVDDVNLSARNYFLASAPASAPTDRLRYFGRKKSLPHLPLGIVDGLGGTYSPLNNMERDLDRKNPLPIYDGDFVVPLNRLNIVGGKYVSDSSNLEQNYGIGGGPRIAFLFFINDPQKGKRHYFLAGGSSDKMLDELKYLGDDITLLDREDNDGYMGVRFTVSGVKGEIVSSVADYGMRGTRPDKNCDSIKEIPLRHEMVGNDSGKNEKQ